MRYITGRETQANKRRHTRHSCKETKSRSHRSWDAETVDRNRKLGQKKPLHIHTHCYTHCYAHEAPLMKRGRHGGERWQTATDRQTATERQAEVKADTGKQRETLAVLRAESEHARVCNSRYPETAVVDMNYSWGHVWNQRDVSVIKPKDATP